MGLQPGSLAPSPQAAESAAAVPAVPADTAAADTSLLQLARWLESTGYRFTTVTPATHLRVNSRPANAWAQSLADVFGWSRHFEARLMPPEAQALMRQAGVLVEDAAGGLRSAVRFSTLGPAMYVHSAFPTEADDSVFFGPDTYRFAALIERTLAKSPATIQRVVDLGCGAGPGGLTAAALLRNDAPEILLTDINPLAVRYAAVNAALAGVPRVRCLQSDLYGAVQGQVDLVLANPPYLVDATERVYRHGGGGCGTELAVRIVAESLPRLSATGTLVLYTGAPIVDRRDLFREAVWPLLQEHGVSYSYEELDPDVFGEELECPAYAQVERIAAVGLVVSRA